MGTRMSGFYNSTVAMASPSAHSTRSIVLVCSAPYRCRRVAVT